MNLKLITSIAICLIVITGILFMALSDNKSQMQDKKNIIPKQIGTGEKVLKSNDNIKIIPSDFNNFKDTSSEANNVTENYDIVSDLVPTVKVSLAGNEPEDPLEKTEKNKKARCMLSTYREPPEDSLSAMVGCRDNKKSYFVVKGKKYSCPFAVRGITREECLELKDSLGIKYCLRQTYDNDPLHASYYEQHKGHRMCDFWGGAVKACGGVENLPTIDELEEIYLAVYKDRKFYSEGDGVAPAGCGSNMDQYIYTSSVPKTAIPKSESDGISEFAWGGFFSSKCGHYGGFGRNIGSGYAICKLK